MNPSDESYAEVYDQTVGRLREIHRTLHTTLRLYESSVLLISREMLVRAGFIDTVPLLPAGCSQVSVHHALHCLLDVSELGPRWNSVFTECLETYLHPDPSSCALLQYLIECVRRDSDPYAFLCLTLCRTPLPKEHFWRHPLTDPLIEKI